MRLIRENANFRRLWFSQMVSNLGDWFGVLAVYALILDFSGSELLLGLIIVIKMMSFAVFSPIAGYIADRYDRRKLMIICDFGRGFTVLAFLLVRTEDLLWLIYMLTAVQMIFAAVFEPAKQASIPNITSGEELVRANVLSNLSWSIIFTSGMGIGGLATAFLGTDFVFTVNGLGYMLSTIFIFRATIPHIRDADTLEGLRNPFRGIWDGYVYLWKDSSIFRPALAKGTMSLFLGALVYLLILISEQVLLAGSLGIGLMYAARGAGTAVGPLAVRRFFPDDKNWINIIGYTMIAGGLCYMALGFTESLAIMMIFVFLAHIGNGALWVSSTVLLQTRTADRFRGRVFSAEFLLFTVAQSVSTFLVSILLEYDVLTIQQAIIGASTGFMLTGVTWLYTVGRKEREWQQQQHEQTAAGVL